MIRYDYNSLLIQDDERLIVNYAGTLLLELRCLPGGCLCIQRHMQEVSSRICAECYNDRLREAHRRGHTLDKSLGASTSDIRVDRHSQHPLHHCRLHTVSLCFVPYIFIACMSSIIFFILFYFFTVLYDKFFSITLTLIFSREKICRNL